MVMRLHLFVYIHHLLIIRIGNNFHKVCTEEIIFYVMLLLYWMIIAGSLSILCMGRDLLFMNIS